MAKIWKALEQLFARDQVPLGLRGERAAARFLKKRGYKIVTRGHRTRSGELDLVALDGRTIVFVEVKTLEDSQRSHPAEAVNQAKCQRLTRAGLQFLKQHGLLEEPARFDVVAVVWPADSARPHIEHIPAAFDPAGFDSFFC